MRLSTWLPLVVAAAATAPPLHSGLNPETGTCVFQHYSAKQYGASPQNWDVTQDHRGVMYFANLDGLLEFDGNSWRLLRLPGKSFVRSVSVDSKGTVYVGGVGEFGLLKPDATGTMAFISLTSAIPKQDRAFADVWRILPTPQGVYFSALSRLFRVNNDGTIKVWRPEKKFARAFYVLNSLYVQTAGTGLMKMGSDDQLTPVAGGERFSSDVVNAASQVGDTAVITTASHLYRLAQTGVEPFPTAADSYFATGLAYDVHVLQDGEIAVGTRRGGLILLDKQGSLDRILSTSTATGFTDDAVTRIFPDSQGGIWITQNNGITRFDRGLSVFGKANGLEGDVESMTRQGGILFAGTTAGLFRLNTTIGVQPRFERLEGINNTVWVVAPYGKDLLAGTDVGVFLVSDDKPTRIFDVARPVFDLSASLHDPNTVYAARRTAVTVITRTEAGWEKTAAFEMPAEEFHTVLEDSDGLVWATTPENIWRLDFRQKPVRSEKFGVAQGVPQGWVNARRLNGHVVFATTQGLKRYDASRNRFVADPELGAQFADGSRDVYNIFDDAAGDVWVTGVGYHGVLRVADKGYKWFAMPLLHSGIDEIYSMFLDPDGTAWAAGADYILHRWERARAGSADSRVGVLTRRIQVIGRPDNWYGGAGPFNGTKLPWRENALRFEFAAPFYEEPSAMEYQVLLEGSDSDWSRWSHETKRDYTHLPEGSYRFRVRARTPHGVVSENAALPFGVLPPWYRTLWAYALYAVLGGFGMWGIVALRTRQLEQDKHRLEAIVEERTVEVRQQRDEIHAQERKSNSLLLNILPSSVADELKATGSVKPVGFENVTVCFTDFVGFTMSSETMAPANLVNALNEYFTRFDEIVARYQLEKLKTIGDSYMFASGLPASRASHAVDAVLAALEMVEVVNELGSRSNGTAWNIRVGLHSGPVIAGVVGTRKFAFDIWGNTVNFAARMESSGLPGRVNMSDRTCRLTRGLIDCESRGMVKIKEGRELPMFLAEGLAVPPDTFAARYREEFGEAPRAIPQMKTALASAERA